MGGIREDIDKFMEYEERAGVSDRDELSREDQADEYRGFEHHETEGEGHIQIYSEEPNDRQFFPVSDRGDGPLKEGGDLMVDFEGVDPMERENEETVQNNYVKNFESGSFEAKREGIVTDQGNETDQSQRTEVKIPGLGGSPRQNWDVQGYPVETSRKYQAKGSDLNWAVCKMGNDTNVKERIEAFGEIQHEKPLFKGKQAQIIQNNQVVSREPLYSTTKTYEQTQKPGELIFKKEGTGHYGNNETVGVIEYAERTQVKHVNPNRRYEKINSEYMKENTKDDETEGFKMRVRKGRTLRVYEKEDEVSRKATISDQVWNPTRKRTHQASHNFPQSPRRTVEPFGNRETLLSSNREWEEPKRRETPRINPKSSTSQPPKLVFEEQPGSAQWTENSETIVRIREGNNYSMRETRGGVDELKGFSQRRRRDSISRSINEEEIKSGVIFFDKQAKLRTRSENKDWRYTARLGATRRHWEFNEAEKRGVRRKSTENQLKSLSRIMSSLNRHHLTILRKNEEKKKDILESEKKRREILDNLEKEKRIRFEFERQGFSGELCFLNQPTSEPQRFCARNNRISFANSREMMLGSFGPVNQQEARLANRAYGEYFEGSGNRNSRGNWTNGPGNRESVRSARNDFYNQNRRASSQSDRWYEKQRQSVKTGGNYQFHNQSGRSTRSNRLSQNEYFSNQFQENQRFSSNQKYQHFAKQNSKTPMPIQGEPRVFYHRANIDSRKRIRNLDEYYTDIFDRARRRKEVSRESHKNAFYQAESTDFDKFRDSTSEREKGYYRQVYHEPRASGRDSFFSKNKYMSTISMNQERSSIQNREVDRYIRKFAQANLHLKERISQLGPYKEVDARSQSNTRRQNFPRFPNFESFRDNRVPEKHKFERPRKTPSYVPKPREPKVTRRTLPSRRLNTMKLNSKGALVKTPLAAKLKKTLNINYFDRNLARKKRKTALSFGVKGNIRVRESSVPRRAK